MNFLEKILSLKSVRSTDQFYLDESGKHVIFRNIRGKTTPIQVTAEEYAEWLNEQGIQVDPADQAQLHEIEEQLEVLERAAEISPQLQSQYEEAFNRQRQQYYQTAGKYYQQALQQEADKTGTAPEDIQHQRQRTYEDTKERTVARAELPDRGWESYLKSYTDALIENSGIEQGSKAWYMVKAFDAVLAGAVSLAKEGVSPTSINLGALLRHEAENNYPSLRDRLDTRYKEYRPAGKEYVFDANMVFGFKNLKENMERKTEAFDELSRLFSSKYSQVYQDFVKSKKTFEPMKPLSEAGLRREDIPEELPEEFSREEAASLYGVFKAFKNSPTSGANRVALHSLARIYEAIPEKDRAGAMAELSDGAKGLHAAHQASFSHVWLQKTRLGMTVNVEHEVEEILRIASRIQTGTNKEKVDGMKQIAARLGSIDGLNAFSILGEDEPSYRRFNNKWVDSSLNAGRQKGDGPDLIGSLADDNARKNVILKNRTLKLMHKPTTKKAPKKDLEVPEEIKKETKPASHGFVKKEKEFVSPEGWRLVPDPSGTWSVLSPDGTKAGAVAVQKAKSREEAAASRSKAFLEARKIIEGHLKEEGTKPPEMSLFNFSAAVHKNDEGKLTEISDFVKQAGLQVRTKIPGQVFSIARPDGVSVELVRAKSNGMLFMTKKVGKETVLKPTPVDVEEVKRMLTDSRKSSNFVPGLSFSQ